MTAIEYNAARPYTAKLWRVVQAATGATVDGVPGEETAERLRVYQDAHELPVDGKCGCVTLTRILLLGQATAEIAIWRSRGLAVDNDGGQDAYNFQDTGRDYLANAGRPGSWWGLATDSAGVPVVQGSDDPQPGYYVSTTSLADGRYRTSDPRRYADGPYLVIPRNWADLCPAAAMERGDVMAAYIPATDRVVPCQYADTGPSRRPADRIGEASVDMIEYLGHSPWRMRNGVARADLGYPGEVVLIALPGTGERKPWGAQERYSRGMGALERTGALELARSWFTG